MQKQKANGAVIPALPPTIESPAPLSEKAVALVLTLGKVGTRRSLKRSQIEVDADMDLITASKIILDSPELDKIRKKFSGLRRQVADLALPSLFQKGTHLVSLKMVEKIDGLLRDAQLELSGLVDEFITAYPQRVRETQERLKSTASDLDYPAVETLRSRFYMNWRFVYFGTPGQLKDISATLFEEERRKAERQWSEAMENATAVLRAGMKQLVDDLLSRLSTDPKTGKAKNFQRTILADLTGFIETLPLRSITEDAELKKLCRETEKILSGLKAHELKTDDKLRSYVSGEIQKVAANLGKLVTDKPVRKITFEEEDD